MNRTEKQQLIDELHSEFERAPHAVIVDFRGLGVNAATQDPVALAKLLMDLIKENPQIKVKGGLVAGSQVLDAEGVKALSTMPSLPELRAKLLGLMKAPAVKLVRLLATPATQMAQVLKAYQDKLDGK